MKIKRVYKVSSYIDRINPSEYPELKDIRLKAKCLVDDGSFEAILYFSDIFVYKMFKIDSVRIDVIYIYYEIRKYVNQQQLITTPMYYMTFRIKGKIY